MRKAYQGKGIFALEGQLSQDLSDPLSLRAALELLQTVEGIEYIHRTCATKEELRYYLRKWVLSKYSAYPILYIISHGIEEGVDIGKDFVSLSDIAEILENRCISRIIIFGSCSTLATNRRQLKKFLQRTGALMICGYKNLVDWLPSIAFEMLLLDAMQENEFSGRGIDAIQSKIEEAAKRFPELDFLVITINELSSPQS